MVRQRVQISLGASWGPQLWIRGLSCRRRQGFALCSSLRIVLSRSVLLIFWLLGLFDSSPPTPQNKRHADW